MKTIWKNFTEFTEFLMTVTMIIVCMAIAGMVALAIGFVLILPLLAGLALAIGAMKFLLL